jgi:hypothetical protein
VACDAGGPGTDRIATGVSGNTGRGRHPRRAVSAWQAGAVSGLVAAIAAMVLVTGPAAAEDAVGPVIRFDPGRLDAGGLQGPPDGLRALHYEFCIPGRPAILQAVSAIDPTLRCYRGSPGRIGCAPDELLCLGHTHQPGYRQVLQSLADLPEIDEIREARFE